MYILDYKLKTWTNLVYENSWIPPETFYNLLMYVWIEVKLVYMCKKSQIKEGM